MNFFLNKFANIKYVKIFTIIIMSILYIVIGIRHFTDPLFFLKIMPPYIPFPLELVYLSGFFEILLGVLLFFKKYRYFSGIGLVLLLVAVFPANVYLYQAPDILCAEKSEALVRMFFQIPLILIAFWHSLENTPKWFSLLCIVLFIPTLVYFLTLEISC